MKYENEKSFPNLHIDAIEQPAFGPFQMHFSYFSRLTLIANNGFDDKNLTHPEVMMRITDFMNFQFVI